MKSIRLIWVGKTQEPYLRHGINAYMKKLSHHIKIDSDEIAATIVEEAIDKEEEAIVNVEEATDNKVEAVEV